MCLAGFVPANESTRLTESIVPVRMELVRLQIFNFQQMASCVFPVSQAPFSSAGNKLHVQIPMNSMNNGFVES